MARPIKIKINVTRILKEHIYEGKNGKYLDLVAWPNKNGTDQYGNTHMVCQELNKAARDAGERGPILGNLLLPDDDPPPAHTERPPARPNRTATPPPDETDEIPF